MQQQTDQTIEAEIQAKGLNAPRVTPADIDAAIVGEVYHVLPDSTVTVCLLTLRNGAKVIGHNYGSIDPAKQDWAVGKQDARAMAVDKVLELEGYALRERLAKEGKTGI